MEANELMIGDFLRYKRNFPDTHLQGKIVKVCGVRGRVDVITIDDGNFHESEHPDWIEPIPLTAEILEKNFPEPDVIAWWPFEDGRFHCETETDGNIMVSGAFNYLHELQHALKLVGVEKEITL